VSDGRWSDVEMDTTAAVDHFSRAIQIYRQIGVHDDTMDGYVRRMAFMHAMLAGHTSLEKALLRILQIQGEETPSGSQWHADLIQRAGRAIDGRPAILSAALVRATDRTRKFRHVAVRAYDTFDPDDAEPAVRAAEKVAAGFAEAIAAFRAVIDSQP
jgi:hypothetical protein